MSPHTSGVLQVGLTGNIGAGKSTVGSMLAESGCLLIDADLLGHEVLAEADARADLVAALGDAILDADGLVDRASLGRRVFTDPDALQRLNAITHPRIRALEQQRIEAWRREPGIAVTEAALLVETGSAARYHRLVVVTAPARERLRRLVLRGMTETDARRRMAAQMDPEEKATHAHYLIDNGGRLEATRAAVKILLGDLEADLDRHIAGLKLVPRVPQPGT